MQPATRCPRVLVVDDGQENVLALERILTGLDAEPVMARSADEALRACQDQELSLVILKVRMPQMDGRELARLLRQEARTAGLPIIFLLGDYSEAADLYRSDMSGAVDFVVTPFEPKVISGKVSVFLALDRQRQEILEHRNHLEQLVRERTLALEALNQQLRDSEGKLARAQHIARLGHWEWNVTAQTLSWSEELYRLFGLPEDTELTPELLISRIHPEDRAINAAFVESLHSGTDQAEISFRLLLPDGCIRYLEQRAEVLRDAAGRASLIAGTMQDVSELALARERLQQAHQIARMGSWDYDVSTDRLRWTATMFQIFGRDPARGEPRWSDYEALVHPDDWPGLEGAQQRAVSAGEPFDLELRILHPAGDVRWVWAKCAVHKDAAGAVQRLSGMTQDITERQRAVAESRALLRATQAVVDEQDFLSAARVVFDVCRELVGASAGYVALLSEDGQENEVILLEAGDAPCNVDPSLPMPIRGLRAEAYHRGRAARENNFLESGYQALLPAGHAPLKNAMFSPMNVESKTVGLIGLANSPSGFSKQDMRLAEAFGEVLAMGLQRSRGHQQLQQSEARYRLLAENASDVIWTTDLALQFTYVSPSQDHLGGTSSSTLSGLTPEHLLSPASWKRVKENFAATLREAQEQGSGEHVQRIMEVEQLAPDGSTSWLEVKARLLCAADGQPVGLLGVNRDITARRAAEQEREALLASVAQSDRLASMGMLAAGVGHEINNPLSFVLYNLESLREDMEELAEAAVRCRRLLCEDGDGQAPDPPGSKLCDDPLLQDDIRQRFDDALTGARRIREIVRGLSTFSRVEQDKLVAVDVRYSMECACNMAFNEIKYRARLIKDFDPVPSIMASEGRISQVFLNLLINAAHAIDEGEVEQNAIRVRIRQEEGDVCIDVSDTGKGISEENLAKIFDPFFTTKDVGVGSGLGLSISKNIIQCYGGQIAVASKPGAGTRFSIRLPALQEELSATPEAGKQTAPEPGVRGRVLIIDDEPSVRAVISRLLREHEVLEAGSGEQGRAILEQDQPFDLILCDLMMPSMSGMDLHSWLKEANPAQAERLVFVTGGAFTPRAQQYLASVDNLRVEKPLDPENFKKMVNTLIRAHRSKDQPAR